MSIYSDLSRIFSTSFLRQLILFGHDKYLTNLSNNFSFIKIAMSNDDYRLLYDEAYKILMENYRFEYIYKSEIYNSIKKRHKSKKSNGLLTELRSGKSIADLVWLNGTTIAFEIKTEIDNNKRLAEQIYSYTHMFKEINVVTYEENIKLIEQQLPIHVGIMYLNDNGKLITYKHSEEYINSLNPETMFLTLRRKEYESIINEKFGYIPKVSDEIIFDECLKLFTSISPVEAHNLMVSQLKKRVLNEENYVIENCPRSLKFLTEKGSLKKSEKERLEKLFN